MKNATFPHCPIDACLGTFRHSHTIYKKGTRIPLAVYYRCDKCGKLSAARKLTAKELVQVSADKAAKRSRKSEAQRREAERQAQRQRELEVVQLPVKGWSPREWFPGYVGEGDQLGLGI